MREGEAKIREEVRGQEGEGEGGTEGWLEAEEVERGDGSS